MFSLQASVATLAVILLSLKVHSQAVYSIDPNSVDISIRNSWCQSQVNSCPLLCLQLPGESSTTAANDCDATDLTYDCVCGNGQSPNASEFSQTLPYFICTEYGTQCVANCGGDTTCQSNCRSQHPCGAQNPTRVNVTTTSSTSATTVPAGATSGTAGVVYTGLGGVATATNTPSSSTSNTKSGAQAALDLGRSYGLAVVFGGIFAGFALVM